MQRQKRPGFIPGLTREEEIATHSSILARKIPRSEEPGGLQAMALQRVRHDLVTTLACMQHGTERDNVFKFYF